MEDVKEVFDLFSEEEKEYLIFKMQMNAFFGIPSPQDAKEFKEWCDQEIKDFKKNKEKA